MKRDIINRLHARFEEYAHDEQGVEYWLARDLQDLLGYTQWRNFLQVVEKAKIACEQAGQRVQDHFADVSKMVALVVGGGKPIEFDRFGTQSAAWLSLVVMVGDP